MTSPRYQRDGKVHREARTPWKPGKVVVAGRVDAHPRRMIANIEVQIEIMARLATLEVSKHGM